MEKLLKKVLWSVLCTAAALWATKDPLTVWIMPNGVSPQERLEQRLKLFTQKTGIPTKVVVLDWGEAWNRVSMTLAGEGNDIPDVLQLGTTWIPYFASRNELLPLNPWLDKINPSRFVPVSWNTTHIDRDTTIFSIPWFIDVRPILGNKRLMKKYHITREKVLTYEGFTQALRTINESGETLDNGIRAYAFAFPGKSDWNIPHNFAPWIWSNGGDFIAKDSSGHWQANILSEKTLFGIAKYLEFILDSLVQPEALQTNTAQIVQRFNAGELAFIVNTAEIVMQTRFQTSDGGLRTSKIGNDSIVVLPIPNGNAGSVSFIGGSNLAIPAKNKRPEALDLLLFLTTDQNLDYYTQQIGFLPASRKVLEKWATDDDYKQLVKCLESGRAYSSIPEWGNIEQILVSMFSAIWDQLEVPALYSEEKIYQIFKDYTLEINKQLNAQDVKTISFDEFRSIWSMALHGKSPIEEAPAEPDYLNENLHKAPWIFAIMVFLGFLFAIKRKRK